MKNTKTSTLSEQLQNPTKKLAHCRNSSKTQQKNYHTVGTAPKPKRKIGESGKIDTPNTQIHDLSLSWLGTSISIKKMVGLN